MADTPAARRALCLVLTTLTIIGVGAERPTIAQVVDQGVFLMPRTRCTFPGDDAAPNAVSVAALQAAVRAEPDTLGNYLDLARCHLTHRAGTILDAVALLTQGLRLIGGSRLAQASSASARAAAGAMPRAGMDVPNPAQLKDVPPTYTPALFLRGLSGIVFVDATVDRRGNIKAARVVGSIPELDDAAMDAVKQWKYAPTSVNGRAVEIRKFMPVRFSLVPELTVMDMIDIARFYAARGHLADAEAALREASNRILASQTPTAGRKVEGAAGGRPRVTGPRKLVDVRPVYPASAQDTRLQGLVVIEAVIEKDGTVGRVRIVQSIPGLDEAAATAVRQWRYTPPLMDGVPVSVVMTATVNFSL